MSQLYAKLITAICFALFIGLMFIGVQVFLFWGYPSWGLTRCAMSLSLVVSIFKTNTAPEWFTSALRHIFSSIGGALHRKAD